MGGFMIVYNVVIYFTISTQYLSYIVHQTKLFNLGFALLHTTSDTSFPTKIKNIDRLLKRLFRFFSNVQFFARSKTQNNNVTNYIQFYKLI